VEERERRIARNEVYWREINELSPPPEPGVLNRVFCECGRTGCAEHVLMTAAEYESVRAASTTFVVVPGHELLEVEHLVSACERFSVVEKHGDAAQVARAAD
jgi:hypothetical protein